MREVSHIILAPLLSSLLRRKSDEGEGGLAFGRIDNIAQLVRYVASTDIFVQGLPLVVIAPIESECAL